MNDIVVAKFGGSSLADAKQFEKVKDIVYSDKSRKYIIPSAPGKINKDDYKITDLLYLCYDHVQHGTFPDDIFNVIEKRYIEISKNLNVNIDIEKHLKDIKTNINSGASIDYTASRGEYLNALILSDYLNFDFIDATEIIFFDEKGCFDFKRTNYAIKNKLLKSSNVVIPGFYGRMPNGEIKTFSRGGSDITGAIISQCVQASLYENWTDVSGFLMADPQIVKNPKPIEKITYRELRELSYMGASVLHEESIFPVRKAGIPINIKNTNRPADKGTLIINDCGAEKYEGSITGIAGKKGFTVIAVEKALMNAEFSYCRKLLSILESNQVPFENMPSGIDSVSIVVADSQLEDKQDIILNEIEKQCTPDSIDVYPNMALIAIVGRGMNKARGVSAKIFSALNNAGVNVRMINQGSSEINVIVGVENSDFEKSIKAVYDAFVK